jgi:hypothetical protein
MTISEKYYVLLFIRKLLKAVTNLLTVAYGLFFIFIDSKKKKKINKLNNNNNGTVNFSRTYYISYQLGLAVVLII